MVLLVLLLRTVVLLCCWWWRWLWRVVRLPVSLVLVVALLALYSNVHPCVQSREESGDDELHRRPLAVDRC